MIWGSSVRSGSLISELANCHKTSVNAPAASPDLCKGAQAAGTCHFTTVGMDRPPAWGYSPSAVSQLPSQVDALSSSETVKAGVVMEPELSL